MNTTAKTETAQVPAVQEAPRQRRESIAVLDPIHILDTGKFEHIQRVATVMAASSLLPDGLRSGEWEIEKVNQETGETFMQKVKGTLPMNRIIANCFLVVNQAVRWNMDPFAVAQCCSVVHGRLMYEGKLVHAVLEAKLGIRLTFKWNDKTGDAFGIVVSGTFPDGVTETVEGTVAQWKTTGAGSPWAKQPRLQLAYRGTREWARLHAPAVLLGVYTEDELETLAENARSLRSTTISQREEAAPVLSLADRLRKGREATTTAPPAETEKAENDEKAPAEAQDGKEAARATEAATAAAKAASDPPAKAEAANDILAAVEDALQTPETPEELDTLRAEFAGAMEHADAETRKAANALFDAKAAAFAKAAKAKKSGAKLL